MMVDSLWAFHFLRDREATAWHGLTRAFDIWDCLAAFDTGKDSRDTAIIMTYHTEKADRNDSYVGRQRE